MHLETNGRDEWHQHTKSHGGASHSGGAEQIIVLSCLIHATFLFFILVVSYLFGLMAMHLFGRSFAYFLVLCVFTVCWVGFSMFFFLLRMRLL